MLFSVNRNSDKISIFFAIFFSVAVTNLYAGGWLKDIKVNAIGKKTRVSFYLDEQAPYTLSHLTAPPRLIVDFKELLESNFDSVKIFNMGSVKNIRSYFTGDDKKGYSLDVCVIELDREYLSDVFWQGSILQIDFLDAQEATQAQDRELQEKMKKKRADELLNEGKILLDKVEYEKARIKFEESLSIDSTLKEAKECLKRTEDILKKEQARSLKDAHLFEKEMALKLRKEKKEAQILEKDLKKRRKEILSRHLDARDLEQKGLEAMKNEKYSEAVSFFDQVLEMEPLNKNAAMLLASARRRSNQEGGAKTPVSPSEAGQMTAKEARSCATLGFFKVTDYADDTMLVFPVSQKISYRFAFLENPNRVMIYFTQKVLTSLPAVHDIDTGNILEVRSYFRGSPQKVGFENYFILDALVIEVLRKTDCRVTCEDNRLLVSVKKTAPSENPIPQEPHFKEEN